MQLSSHQSIKGFSFVEILVVTGVISMLVAVSIAGYKQFNERQKVIAGGQTVKNIIRDVQSRAYTGEVDCTVCGCTPGSPGYDPASSYLSGWRIDFRNETVVGVCNNAATFSQKTFDNYSLSPEMNLTQPGAVPTGAMFKSFPATVVATTSVCVSSAGLPGLYYNVGIHAGGTITDSGGLVASCTSP